MCERLDKYYLYKCIFNNNLSKKDVEILRNKCPEEDKSLVDKIIRCTKYKEIGYYEMNHIIDDINKMNYVEECQNYIGDVLNKMPNNNDTHYGNFFNESQSIILNRIISSKSNDDRYIDHILIDKKCPHCGQLNSAPINTTYIICGIDMMGILPIDNCSNACNCDWCFKCGKKLCKNWYLNELYITENRVHDNICCQLHAITNNNKYPDDYCHCKCNRKDNDL